MKLRKRGGIDMTLADIDAGIDAVFLPGKIPSYCKGCEYYLLDCEGCKFDKMESK